MKILSICIPTYNRAEYIKETLRSIFDQIEPEFAQTVEVCISDNASSDNTESVIVQLQKVSPIQIVYSRNEKNEGADRNYMKVVSLARGEYCWFMGSDDLLAPGALKSILDRLQSRHSIYLCNRLECDLNMTPQSTRWWLKKSSNSQVFQLHDRNDLLRYLDSALSIGALFSYLSSIIFKKSEWDTWPLDEKYIGTAYSHVYRLLSFVKKPNTLEYVHDALVLCRGQNDSFASEGMVKRVMLDIDGYALLANDFFHSDEEVKKSFLAVLYRERNPLKTLVYLRLRTDDSSWSKLQNSLFKAGYPKAFFVLVGYMKFLLLFAKKFVSPLRR